MTRMLATRSCRCDCSLAPGLGRRSARDRAERELLDLDALRGPNQLPDRHLAHAQALRDRPIAQPLTLQPLDATQPLAADTPLAASPTRWSAQRGHPALRIALLIAAQRALRSPKCTRALCLLGESRLDQEHHRVGFRHCV